MVRGARPPRLLVLCAIDPSPTDPLRRCIGQSRFLGEAGLWLAGRGVDLICATPGATEGFRPTRGAWEPTPVEGIDALYDRHHGTDRAEQRRWEARGLPVANPPDFQELCDDKLAFSRWGRARGLPVPETVPAEDPRWRGWDGAFRKPRWGRGGAGVARLTPGEEPATGVIQREAEPRVPGESIRILLQRSAGDGWVSAGAFRRLAPAGSDVSGLSCGAEASPLLANQEGPIAGLVPDLVAALQRAPGSHRVVEVGVDVILGREGPAVLEWNARPGRSLDRIGREDLRRDAQRRPFEVLLGWIGEAA